MWPVQKIVNFCFNSSFKLYEVCYEPNFAQKVYMSICGYPRLVDKIWILKRKMKCPTCSNICFLVTHLPVMWLFNKEMKATTSTSLIRWNWCWCHNLSKILLNVLQYSLFIHSRNCQTLCLTRVLLCVSNHHVDQEVVVF